MAYKVIILYQLYMPSYFLGTFTEYPYIGTGTVYSTAFTTGDRTDLVFFIERAFEIDLSTQSIGIFIASGLVDITPFRYQMFNTSIGIHDG